MSAEVVEYLSQFAHDNRVELFNEKIKERTDYVTLVLEDIFHAQNTSAAIRTCDCFAIQNIHVIEKGETLYGISRKYGVSIEELTKLNPKNALNLKVGEKLILPKDKTPFIKESVNALDT